MSLLGPARAWFKRWEDGEEPQTTQEQQWRDDINDYNTLGGLM